MALYPPGHTFTATVDPTPAEDDQNGYLRTHRWINTATNREFVCLDATDGAAIWHETAPTTLPRDYQYEEDLVEEGTTSGNWQTKLTLTTPTLIGKYRVCATWEGSTDTGGGSNPSKWRLYDDSADLTLLEPAWKSASSSSMWSSMGGIAQVELSFESKVLRIQYCDKSSGNKETRIRNARMEFWKVEESS